MKFTRITIKPTQMGGVPCIRGLRIPVATVVGMMANGMSNEEILRAYPDLETQDIRRGAAVCGGVGARTRAAAFGCIERRLTQR